MESLSFSSEVKSELSHHFGNGRHCWIAEIAALINMCGHIEEKNDKFCIIIQTENVVAAKKLFTLVKKTFKIDSKVLIRRNRQLKKNRIYILSIDEPVSAEKILLATGILQRGKKTIQSVIDPLMVSSMCCKRAYIRGAFIAGGSLTDPEKNYHLEFVNTSPKHAESLMNLINSFGIESKMIERKDHMVVYLKDGEQIVDLLNIMEAHVTLMQLENVRILKDMRNNVNRKVNCETANLNKVVAASVKQVDDITFVKSSGQLGQLAEPLQEIAELRLQFPDASLKELGRMLNPPVGKSGVNHRLRKISEVAERKKVRDYDREDNYCERSYGCKSSCIFCADCK